ncbi:MAG: fumarate/nitrate reduction transcriptional regulator Fnr [Betaproteobacteria bacterium]|nr:fumarate/nitrate reduction transcriptional regulator Fnr [Betaproteobacteria bacterium]
MRLNTASGKRVGFAGVASQVRPTRRASRERKELLGAYVDCRHCSLFTLCLPAAVDQAELGMLERVIKHRRLLERGEDLFRQGERFRYVYAIKSGSLKTYTAANQKTVQVTGFHLPGELLALDAVGAGAYLYSARALQTASVCEFPFDRLEELGALARGIQRQLLRIMGGQIQHELSMHMLHCKTDAPARVATFLVNLSMRLAERGLSRAQFRLSMSREDIGNYLGLAKETVIRVLAEFEHRRLISVSGKSLRIHDVYRLESLAGLHAAIT